MAAALSRALKLPGKKSSELGEYDPLTQADSEDESEEDDLVLNYPRNGLGRGSCLGSGASDLRAGRAGRLVEDDDEVEEDEEEWREQYPSKNRQEREELKTRQYWSQREGSRDVGSGGGGTGSTGSSGLGLGSGSDLEEKAARLRGTIRTAFFLVPLCCAVMLVLLCAFLLPCKQSELDKSPQWERELGEAGGGFFPALALLDVDGDAVEDVLVGVTRQINESQPAGFQVNSKEHSVVAVSAVSGKQLWQAGVKEPVKSIQCGLQPLARPVSAGLRGFRQGSLGPEGASAGRGHRPLCLVIGSSHLTAVNGATGKQLWSASPGKIVSQAVLTLDLDGDEVPDFLIATLPVDQVSSSFGLSLLLLSGAFGNQIGHSVTFNLTARGKLIGPDLHVTGLGAYYILFGLGTVEAASLKDIYIQAMGRAPTKIGALKVKDPSWEKLRKNSSLIHISSFSSCEQVEFLLPLVAGLCNNHNNFDSVSNQNSSRSDWVLVCGSGKLSVLRESDTHAEWTVNSADIHGRPAPGQFNEDGVPDLLIQQSVAPGVRKVQVIDGASGRGLWEAEFVCPQLDLEGSSMVTSSGISVFLFWAGELQTLKNLTKAPVSQGVAPTVDPANPVLRRLYLLHPTYPTILMELTTTADTLLSAAVSYQEQQKDALYITVSARPAKPGAQVVRSLSLKASIAGAKTVMLGEDKKAGASVRPGAFEINKFFKNLSFRHQ